MVEQSGERIYSDSFESDPRGEVEVDGETINKSIPVAHEEASISVESPPNFRSLALSELGGLTGSRCVAFTVYIRPENIGILYSDACKDRT